MIVAAMDRPNPAVAHGPLIAAFAALPVLVRLALLPLSPAPLPLVHDEFSYLLAGDTLAHARLTNPTPPAAEFLEAFHVLVRPTYMSKYPIGQGAALAAGQVAFGHPWWGVVASSAAMGGALAWALLGWLPRRWAAFGALALVLRFGASDYWIDSYWGGAVAAFGGALVAGAVGRLLAARDERPRGLLRLGVIGGAGAGVLLNSRPWEGFLLCAALGAVFLTSRKGRGRLALASAGAAPPLAAALLLLGWHSWRVTGSPTRLPYLVYDEQHAFEPVFIFGAPGRAAHSRYPEIRRVFEDWEPRTFSRRTGSLAGDWWASEREWLFHRSVLPAAVFAAAFLAVLAPTRRLTPAVAAAAIFTAGLGLERMHLEHYLAPGLALFGVVLAGAARAGAVLFVRRNLTRWRRVACLLVTLLLLLRAVSFAVQPVPPVASLRAAVLDILEARAGRHLVVVRYVPAHPVHADYVSNAADVPGAKIVWMREPDALERAAAFAAYPARHVWLFEPDRSGRLTKYP